MKRCLESGGSLVCQPLDLLIIDGSPADHELVRTLLAGDPSRYILRQAVTGAEGARHIAEHVPDCVLMDCGLPDQDALSLLRGFAEAQGIQCPFVLMSGSSDPDLCARAFGDGAQDFLSKNELNATLLDHAIQHSVKRFRTALMNATARTTLAEAEHAMLRVAQEAAGIGTFELDLKTGATRFGGTYFGLYGLSVRPAEWPYETWLQSIHPDDRERIHEETQTAIRTARSFDYEYRVLWPTGTVRWLLGRGAVSRDQHGLPARLTGINADITAAKSTEAALLSANTELEEFALTAGHDLQAPLRTVSVFAELLERSLESYPDTRVRQAVEQVIVSSRRMRKLIGNLLEFARAGHEAAPVFHQRPLRDAIELAINNLHSDIEATETEISYAGLDEIHLFGEEMIQVFQNLIGNAIKYRMPGTTPRIHVCGMARRSDWLIAVKDEGIGFDMAYAGEIFHCFRRLVSQDIAGSGLGLPICKRIVERHGGHIWAESAPGQGATFFFTLPRA